jgi:RNA polymerase sigma-70 factor, ECF subfamily
MIGMPPEPGEVTQLLKAWHSGDQKALEQLAQAVQSELHRLAHHYLSRESAGHTLQPTALVNEAYMRLLGWSNVDWQSRTHFYAIAAKMMRRVLVNHAIAHGRKKRGGSAILVSLTEADAHISRAADVVDLDEALLRLAEFDEKKSQIVELRFFGGLGVEETAEVLGISSRTVHREWDLARSWLFRELRGGRSPSA